jgi:hypothetical protein
MKEKGGIMAKYQIVHRYDGESPVFYVESSDKALLEKICGLFGEVCTKQYDNRLQVRPSCQEDHFTMKWQLYDHLLGEDWEPLGGGFFRKGQP